MRWVALFSSVGRSVSRAPSLSPYLPTKIFSPRAPPRGALPPAFLSFVQPQQNDDDDKIPSFGLMGWDGEQQIHPRARRGALGQGEEGLIICPSAGRPTDPSHQSFRRAALTTAPAPAPHNCIPSGALLTLEKRLTFPGMAKERTDSG
ncbi:hypothetical protein niasHT_026791 [Heterodera trifolii]|uniref:Uncharacterized protein n=1 Tax=Heterodera trifolii TaxID=157864 RepID=A0ABD2JW72_9BILA